MSIDLIWEKIHSTSEWGQYPNEHIIRFIARNYYKCSPRKNIKILDFGCGAGANTWYLAREGFDTYAFDGSESAVKKTQNKLNNENLTATLDVFDGTNTSYEDNFFDCVIDGCCIYANCLSDIKTMYQEVYRILKNNGQFLSIVFSTESTGYGSGKKIEENTYTDIKEGQLKNRGICHFFQKKDIYPLLENIGFRNILIESSLYEDQSSLVAQYLIKMKK